MKINHCFAMLGAIAMLAGFAGQASAQGPTVPPIAPKPTAGSHTRSWGGLRGRMGGMMHANGQIVGNKNTKVYHLPGDSGNMPAEKNRVYFRTEREAIAAGYHAAKTRGGTRQVGRPSMPRATGGMGGTMHSGPGTGRMNGHLPK